MPILLNHRGRLLPLAASAVLLASCCPGAPANSGQDAKPQGPVARVMPQERHFGELRQLTFGGENAEAYWSFDGSQLVFQASPPGAGCDQIFRMSIATPEAPPVRVSNGEGATTCAYFLPGDTDIIYASTHLGGAACPPKPDRSQGYVWALYDSYDIFRTSQDGAPPKRLTETPGYDAEATVCKKDGSIIFTSVRDGDLELYRMKPDGSEVKRLTDTPGYDGGAFFNDDCSKIVWRASRPEGQALADYQRLLKQNLVRPTKMDIWVANADGSDARQVTHLDKASFAPFWYPGKDRILFSSNHQDPKGREFELWAINADGTDLERITHSLGFDGFPMFSPDGKWLAFASNRATAPGKHDTNVFITKWQDFERKPAQGKNERPADRVMADVRWLAAPEREGRGLGSKGLAQAADFIAKRYEQLGVSKPSEGSYRQSFEVPVAVKVGPGTALEVDGKKAGLRFMPHPASASASVTGQLVSAGYGIVSKEHGIDDYAGKNVRGKVVLVRRFVPAGKISGQAAQRRLSSVRHKAWLARERGAKALLVADVPLPASKAATAAKRKAAGHGKAGAAHAAGTHGKAGTAHHKAAGHGKAGAAHVAGAHGKPGGRNVPADAPFARLVVDGYGDAGIPVMQIERKLGEQLLARKGRAPKITLTVELVRTTTQAANVVGLLPANAADKLPGAVLLGAHYDHLGRGGRGSLAPDSNDYHLGADDNASGVAALLEAARQLAASKERRRDVWLVAFSAEESGVIGSSHFVKHRPKGADKLMAMLNMDMVGRVRDNTVSALGGGTASEWPALVAHGCRAARLSCTTSGDGYGPSDQMPFYSAGVPVLHFFSGAHRDYHKPSDSADRVNAAGAAQVAKAVATITEALSDRSEALSYKRVAGPPPAGDRRSWGASLGTVPDYADPGKEPGMRISDVRPGGAAEQAGMRGGDRLLKLSSHQIRNVRDLMYALQSLKPDQQIEAVVQRDGKKLTLQVTLQKSKRRHR